MPTSELQLTIPTSLQDRWQRRARYLISLCMLGLLLPFVSRLLMDFNGHIVWALDLLSHWQWLWLAGMVILSVVAGLGRRRWLLCLLAAPLPWLSASVLLPQQQRTAPMFTVASANVNLDNTDVTPLAKWLGQEKPDVVVVLEVTPEYAAGLEKLAGYPFRLMAPEWSPFGIALLSRQPLVDAKVVRDAEGIAHIQGAVDFGGQLVKIIAFHPMPPLAPAFHEARNEKLAVFARESGDIPTIVAGDFNATPWSTALLSIERSGLRRATGLAPTWPSAGRGYFGIPIDHVIATRDWKVVSSAVGPDIGSDHFPVVARLSIVRP